MKNISFLILFLFSACLSPQVAPPDPVFPIPSERQLAWHELEYYGFIHFNMNTFSNMEWGMGDEKPSEFNPSALDARQWARIAKEAGMKGLIITAKHHDGFCLWPSAYTEHSVKNSPWRNGQGDLIKELKEACDEYGLKMGIYYSPWDRNHADYGKPEYITYMRDQLTELLTNYGDIFEVWFDGANGGTGFYGGANEERKVDKKGYYDWENTIALVRELQPHAVIFGDAGPDVRWVGNENGYAYSTTWSNLMRDSVYAGMPEYADEYSPGQENGTHYVHPEADVSIRPGWYYHEYEDHKVKTLAELLDIYYLSIGQNSSLLINFPVDKRGLIHETDEAQILKLAQKIKEDFAEDLAKKVKVETSNSRGKGFEAKQVLNDQKNSYWAASDGQIQNSLTFTFSQPTAVNRFLAQEHIALGQRIKSFSLEGHIDGKWQMITEGTTIGHKRILRFAEVKVSALRLNILDAKACPTLAKVSIFNAPKLVVSPEIKRWVDGSITLSAPDKGVEIYYTLDESTPEPLKSTLYKSPLKPTAPGILKAISFDPQTKKSSDLLTFSFDVEKDNWEIVGADEKSKVIIDEDPKTWWSAKNNSIILNLNNDFDLLGITYLPPQNRYMQGIISSYEVAISLDNKTWKSVAKGEFSNIGNHPIEQQVKFPLTKARYVKLTASKTLDGELPALAEIGVLTK
jgi:alpha-L-fucosidase